MLNSSIVHVQYVSILVCRNLNNYKTVSTEIPYVAYLADAFRKPRPWIQLSQKLGTFMAVWQGWDLNLQSSGL